MADESKPKLTDELDLGPGVVVTPGHEVTEPRPRFMHGDRKLDAQGNILNPGASDFGSTYPDEQLPPGASGGGQAESGMVDTPNSRSRAVPDRKTSTPEAAG